RYVGAAGVVYGNRFAPVFGAVDNFSTAEIRRIDQRSTAAINLCHKGVIVSARIVWLESIDCGKRADRRSAYGPSGDVSITTAIERDAATEVVEIAAEPC